MDDEEGGRSRVHGTPLPGQEQEILPRRAGTPRRLGGGAGARKGRSSASAAIRAQHSENIEEGVTSVFFCFVKGLTKEFYVLSKVMSLKYV